MSPGECRIGDDRMTRVRFLRYVEFAYQLLTQSLIGIFLFFVLNVAVYFTWFAYHSTVSAPTLNETTRSAYANMSDSELEQMYTETWEPGWIYEPWLGFREKPRRGLFVNVDARGFRHTAGSSNSLTNKKRKYLFVHRRSTERSVLAIPQELPST